MDPGAPQVVYCCGPFEDETKSLFLCPVCDDDRVTGLEGAATVCCVEWLTGQWVYSMCLVHGPLTDLAL